MERIRNYGGAGRGGGFIAQLRRTLRLFLVTISGDSASRRKKGDRIERETETEEEKGRRKERRRETSVEATLCTTTVVMEKRTRSSVFFLSALPTDIFTGTINVIDAHRFNDHSLSHSPLTFFLPFSLSTHFYIALLHLFYRIAEHRDSFGAAARRLRVIYALLTLPADAFNWTIVAEHDARNSSRK